MQQRQGKGDMRAILLLIAGLLGSGGILAAGQDFEDGRALGLLLGATITPRAMTSVVVGHCVELAPEIRKTGEDTKAIWEKNNLRHEAEARNLIDRQSAKVESVLGKAQAAALVTNTRAALQSASVGGAQQLIAKTLNGKPREIQRQWCLSMFSAIREGNMDISAIQPDAYQMILNAR